MRSARKHGVTSKEGRKRRARRLARGTPQRGAPRRRATGLDIAPTPMHRSRRGPTTSRGSPHRSSDVKTPDIQASAVVPDDGLPRSSCTPRGGACTAATVGTAPSPAANNAAPHPSQTAPSGLRSSISQQLSTGCGSQRPSFSLSSQMLWRPHQSSRDGRFSCVHRCTSPPRCCPSAHLRAHLHRRVHDALGQRSSAAPAGRLSCRGGRAGGLFAPANVLLEFLADHQSSRGARLALEPRII